MGKQSIYRFRGRLTVFRREREAIRQREDCCAVEHLLSGARPDCRGLNAQWRASWRRANPKRLYVEPFAPLPLIALYRLKDDAPHIEVTWSAAAKKPERWMPPPMPWQAD